MSEQSEKILIDLLKKAPKDVMDNLSKKVGVTDTKLKKAELVNQIIDHAFNNGVYEFVGKINEDDLITIHYEAGVNLPEKKEKGDLVESFFDEIEKSGLEELLQKLKPNTLQQINIKIGAESEGASSSELAVDVAGQILFLGCKPLFKELTEAQLKDFCVALGLSGNGNKESKANRILNVAFPGVEESENTDTNSKKKKTTNGKTNEKSDEKPEKKTSKKTTKKKISKEESSEEEEEVEEKKEKSKPKESKKRKHTEEENTVAEASEPKKSRKEIDEEIKKTRKPLEKGITKDEIFQGYWNEELKDFCTKNKISSVGKKKDIIKRIVEFLENPAAFSEEKQKKGRGRKPQTKQQTDTAASDQPSTTPSTSTTDGVQ